MIVYSSNNTDLKMRLGEKKTIQEHCLQKNVKKCVLMIFERTNYIVLQNKTILKFWTTRTIT